jgi:hypothetical protein|tara:strand:+ start:329 stop:772 length:444 start_codon:yes stop_codon:yes gene_type:complete
MLDKYANETINQKIIEDVYEVDKITQSTIILSHNAEDNHQFETEDSKIFLNESDADEYAKTATDTDNIKSEYESDLYVDEVIIENEDIDKKKISIDKLSQHDLKMILLRNTNLEVKEVTITKKVLVEKSKDTSVEAVQDHTSMSVNQ